MTRSGSHCAGRVALEGEQHHAGPSPAVRMFERSQVVARLISFRYGEKAREVACELERVPAKTPAVARDSAMIRREASLESAMMFVLT